MKGKQFEIVNEMVKANGVFECYNVTEDMVHLVRVGENGKKLTPNAKNLLNITGASFTLGVAIGGIKAVAA